MAAKTNAKPQVLETIPKGTDLEVHIRVVTIGDVSYVEMRDYVPSLKEYGRGYWIPDNADSLKAAAAAFETRRKALK